MLAYPRIGQLVRIHYAAKRWRKYGRMLLPYQNQLARVVLACRGAKKNHLVRTLRGSLVVVPCGNLDNPCKLGASDEGKGL